MKWKNSTGLIVALVLACSFSFGQMGSYHYKRMLPAGLDKWNRIVLPDELFGKLNADLSDIRIYGITKNNDTLTAPYILEESGARLSGNTVMAKLINQSRNAKGYYFTFETTGENNVNQLLLDIKQENFDWRIQLEGSADQKDWFTVLDNYRILSISNELTHFHFTTLVFPDIKYRYYRLLIKGAAFPVLRSATITRQQMTAGIERNYTIRATDIRQDKERRQTVMDINLAIPVPVSSVKIYVQDKIDYYRPVTVQSVTDSFNTQGGRKYSYRVLGAAVQNSIEKSAISFNSTVLQKLQVVIDNHDNEPLKIDSVEVKGSEHALIARFAEPAEYWLVYGNSKAAAPDYDISRFTEKIPAGLKPVALGNEETVGQDKQSATLPLFQNKVWLWVIMVLIITILGWFSISMMKKAGSK